MFLHWVGHITLGSWRRMVHVAAIATAILRAAISPRNWTRTVCAALARQIILSGVEAIPLICVAAFCAGVTLVLQAQIWLDKVNLSNLLGQVLNIVIVREIGPILTALFVASRSGNAIAVELASLHIGGQVWTLEAMGIDPFAYLVMPRVLGLMLSAFCLAILFTVVSVLSGCAMALFMTNGAEAVADILHGLLWSVRPLDILNFLAKTLLPALLVGSIACSEGLSVGRSSGEIAAIASGALQRALIVLLITSVTISLLTYL